MSDQLTLTIQSGAVPVFLSPLELLVSESRNTVTVMSSKGNVSTSEIDARSVRYITNQLLEKYPLITLDDEVLGEPRLQGTRFSVSNVLSGIIYYDSLKEVIDEYEDRYTEQQLKDAIGFARDFLNALCRYEGNPR